MMLDKQLQFADSQALTSTALLTNVIDMGAVDKNDFVGEPMAVVFNVETAADQTTGDEDYTFVVESASDAAITTDRKELARRKFESGTPDAPAENADLLVAGFVFAIVLPPGGLSEVERYLAVRYTGAGTSPTITLSAHLVPLKHVPTTAHYASGYTIS
jgi:hypothetical protein